MASFPVVTACLLVVNSEDANEAADMHGVLRGTAEEKTLLTFQWESSGSLEPQSSPSLWNYYMELTSGCAAESRLMELRHGNILAGNGEE